ncbi:MAG: hypothetical protein HQL13_02030 [Candidatus Omnitrophica bacterium]|nr:hypothetical protein [Candidatus Omnitrophota bacterium]
MSKNSTTILLLKIFRKFLKAYGPRKWWPAKTRFEMMAGALLTQNVSWSNAKKAIDNLKKAGLLSPEAILAAPHELIADKIRSSRFYNQKTKNLKALSGFIMNECEGSLDKMFDGPIEDLRKRFLKIKGVGRESADCILLYAGKKLSFVSDAYTRRFLLRYGILEGQPEYEQIRAFFMAHLPQDLYLYNEYHALIDYHGARVCQAKPECQHCPVRNLDKTTRCQYTA